jgi:hypothetical protein
MDNTNRICAIFDVNPSDENFDVKMDQILEAINECEVPVEDNNFSAEEKTEFVISMLEKIRAIFDCGGDFKTKIALFESAISEVDLDDRMVLECARIINDCTEYPYFGEENSGKYNFEHCGLKCRIKRSNDWWQGRVYINKGSLMNSVNIHDEQFDVHGGIDSIGPNHISFSCDNEASDISQMTEILSSAIFEPDTLASKTYKDYDFVVNETKKLAELALLHLSEFC